MSKSKTGRVTVKLDHAEVTRALFGKSKKSDKLYGNAKPEVLGEAIAKSYWESTLQPFLSEDYLSFVNNGLNRLVHENRPGGRGIASVAIDGIGRVKHEKWEKLNKRYLRSKKVRTFRTRTGGLQRELEGAIRTYVSGVGVYRRKRVNKLKGFKVTGGVASFDVNFSYRYNNTISDPQLSSYIFDRYLNPKTAAGRLYLETGHLKKLGYFEGGASGKRRNNQPARPLFDPVVRAYGRKRRRGLKKL